MAESNSTVSPDVKLKRFLYTSTELPHYVTGDIKHQEFYMSDKLTCVSDYLKSPNPEKLFNIVEIVHSEGLLPRREPLFFVLAVAASLITGDLLKARLYRTLGTLIKDSCDLALFVKFYTARNKKFSSAVNKLVGRYYNNKEPLELLEELTLGNSYYGWTHKDLLKLSHFKWNSLATAVIAIYILFGLKKAELVADGKESVNNIIDHLRKLSELKRSEDEQRIIELIPELHCTIKRVPSYYHNSQQIWEVLLPEMRLCDIISSLPNLYKLGFLKSNTSFQNKIVEYLTNSDKIQRSKIHPVEVFIGLRNFEKGGKPIDPQLKIYLDTLDQLEPEKGKRIAKPSEPTKCPIIVSALHKAMQMSFQNLQPWGRKIMITIDTTDKMQTACLHNKNLSCLDAATILTLSILRIERDVTVAVFNDNKITIVNLEKNATFNQAISKIKQVQGKSNYCTPTTPLDWAMSKKKSIDVFINLLYYHHWLRLIPAEIRSRIKPLVTLNTYRKKMSLPHAKLISFSLYSPRLEIADGSPNVLDVCGFDKNVPLIIEAFSKGLF